VDVSNVVVELGTEPNDLVLADVDLVSSHTQLEKAVGEVVHEEDRGVTDEADPGEGHESASEAKVTVLGRVRDHYATRRRRHLSTSSWHRRFE
jgi:hypothetical protein